MKEKKNEIGHMKKKMSKTYYNAFKSTGIGHSYKGMSKHYYIALKALR